MSIYLRPVAFVDAPFGFDEQTARLAGGMTWFSAVEVITRSGKTLVPVERIDAFRSTLSETDRFDRLWCNLTAPRAPLVMGTKTLRFEGPSVMGILNLTPDSLSGDGIADTDLAASKAVDMAAAGAAIIDIGAESTRPGAKPVWEQDELARLTPVLHRLRGADLLISADTRKAAVMRAAIDAGARVINDVSALLWDDQSLRVVAEARCPIILMHHQGDPESMQQNPSYANVLLDIYDWVEARIEACVAGGIARDAIIIDPGIGFGKTLRHNLELLNGLSIFHGLGCPLLLGASRKRFIGALSREDPVEQRLPGSLAVAVVALSQGVQLLRVHDVVETVQAVRVWRGLRDAALIPPV